MGTRWCGIGGCGLRRECRAVGGVDEWGVCVEKKEATSAWLRGFESWLVGTKPHAGGIYVVTAPAVGNDQCG